MTDITSLVKWAELAPVQGDSVYLGPCLCCVFGLFGVGAMRFSRHSPWFVKLYLHVAGVLAVLLPAVFLGIDIRQYPGFTFADGLVLPVMILVNGAAFSSLEAVVLLAVPALGIMVCYGYAAYLLLTYHAIDVEAGA